MICFNPIYIEHRIVLFTSSNSSWLYHLFHSLFSLKIAYETVKFKLFWQREKDCVSITISTLNSFYRWKPLWLDLNSLFPFTVSTNLFHLKSNWYHFNCKCSVLAAILTPAIKYSIKTISVSKRNVENEFDCTFISRKPHNQHNDLHIFIWYVDPEQKTKRFDLCGIVGGI